MPVKLVKKPVKASIEVAKQGKTTRTEEQVAVADVSKPTASVGFSASYTKNMGRYESVKVSVSLFTPVVVSPEPGQLDTRVLDQSFEAVQAWVNSKMLQVLDEVEEAGEAGEEE